jgi:hypothetical protein
MDQWNKVILVGLGAVALCLSPACSAAEASSPPSIEAAVAVAIAKRRANEARALVLDPHLDRRDVSLLSDEELNSSPVPLHAIDKAFSRDPTLGLVQSPASLSSSAPRYKYWVRRDESLSEVSLREVAVDPELQPPKIQIDVSDPSYPKVRVAEVATADGTRPLYFFEFDTSESFDTPNFWRYPSLMPTNFSPLAGLRLEPLQNLSSRSGLSFDIFRATQRNVRGHDNEIRYPFRASAMRLPNDWGDLSFAELERHAFALGYGLSPHQVIEEIYRYGRHSYAWGDDTVVRTAVDVFRTGLGACGAVNNLIGTLLEMNGIRYRIVAGFNPKLRVIFPDGGHSAIEVLDPESYEWSYVDAYFDILLAGTSAATLASLQRGAAAIPAAWLQKPHHQAIFGKMISLGQLFKYRTYGDQHSRLPMISMLRLNSGAGEREYGRGWTLNVVEPQTVDVLFAERRTIYVRARYITAEGHTIQPLGEPPQVLAPSHKVKASPWATTSFEIFPRNLIAAYPPPKRPEKRNPCHERQETAIQIDGPFQRESGNAFIVPLREAGPSDTASDPILSQVLVCENGVPLGPAHAIHDEIRTKGNGRFSHWLNHLYFSASDNSDLNTNGRAYSIVQP